MKKFTIIGLSVVLLVVAFLLWHHPHRSTLTGTWIADIGHGMSNTTTVQPDGSYVALVTGAPNGQTQRWVGRMDVKDGLLINTITNMTAGAQTAAVFKKPVITRAKIVHMDGHALVIQPPDLTNTVAFIKQ